jgi:murein DD-endopeptidase MepM/ murein hydrolase activator NlpD
MSAIELGTEPPLRVDGQDAAPLDRRALSLRWFAGTILTAVAGSTLMGGAIYSALDGEVRFADLPRFATIARTAVDIASNLARKGDRIPANTESVGASSTIRVSTTTKVGNREIVKTRPFTRVVATLTMAPTQFAKQVPEFNPVKLMADSDADRFAAEPDTDGDLSFVIRDLAGLDFGADEGPVPSTQDVLAKVREVAAFETASRFQGMPGVTPASTGPLTAYASTGGFTGGFIPQNLTLVAKSVAVGEVKTDGGEVTITVAADTTVENLLRERGATVAEARAIAAAFGSRTGYGTTQVRAGQKVRILNANASPLGTRQQPVRVSLFSDNIHLGTVALSDIGNYVAVADLGDLGEDPAEEEEESASPSANGRMRLYNSIYETALKHSVPQGVVDELVRTVSFDVDFNRRVATGDAFEIFFSDDEDARPELLYATLTLGGEEKRFFRFQSTDDGVVDYYDESGRSAKKFLMRKPMNGGIMRSGYGARRHPILGYTKMHTGVDWAAPTGSPIVASGNGTIQVAEWEGGYGRYVKIRHTNGYETAYGHMSAFARGIKQGVRVRQGQIIGYVGSTGLSTGPHLHYEVLVNGRFVNPMRIKLPRGRELDGSMLAEFQRERERIESLLGKASAGAAPMPNRNRS